LVDEMMEKMKQVYDSTFGLRASLELMMEPSISRVSPSSADETPSVYFVIHHNTERSKKFDVLNYLNVYSLLFYQP
jgi:hypothetical protein